MEKFLLGVDLGTSSLKIILVDVNGNTLDSESGSYDLIIERRGYSEQNPLEWIKAFDFAFMKLIERNQDKKNFIEGISFSGQMHSIVLLDKNNHILRNAILWNDTRNTQQCKELNSNYAEDLQNFSRNVALEGFSLPKLVWVKENEPDIFSRVDCVLMPKDYLCWYLTGIKQTEFTDAAGTLILNITKKEWNYDFLKKLGIPPKIMPKLNSSDAFVGYFDKKILNKFGIEKEIKVFSGSADNVCGALGSGIIDDSKALVSIGTSGVFMKITYNNSRIKDLHFLNFVEDKNYCMGVTIGAGISFKWFRDKILNTKDSYDEIMDKISRIETKEDNPIFTPWLFGERTPYIDSDIRASFVGLDFTHTNMHLAKSIIEGITFSINHIKNIYEKNTGQKINKIICTGGSAKSDIWLQIQANIFNCEILTIRNLEGPALGAAMIAAVGSGIFRNFEECSNRWIVIDKSFKPNLNEAIKYEKIFNTYLKIYSNIKKISMN